MDKLKPEQINHADIVVGIPSYNEADNIGFVVEQISAGLGKYFPDYMNVIINVDNSSPDDTRSAFLNTRSEFPKIYISTPRGVKGKGNNLYNLFIATKRLKARTTVVVDADLTSITPEWIRELANPIFNGYDFAAPRYARNKYDGTITNNICFPLIYGLLGRDVRQPIGGDFAFSLQLAEHFLKQEWTKTTREYGIDIFMTTNAISGGFKCCQVGLGAKIHKPSESKLGPMFTQVVETLFQTLLSLKANWLGPIDVKRLPFFGQSKLEEPQSLGVDHEGMKSTALQEFSINRKILETALSPRIFKKLSRMYERSKINIGTDLWTKLVYRFLYSYDTTDLSSDLVEAMKALYFGRVVTFANRTLGKGHDESESMIQSQAEHFFKHRSLLTREYAYSKAVA